MTILSSAAQINPQIWDRKIFNGDWVAAKDGEYQVIETATGSKLSVVGRASQDPCDGSSNPSAATRSVSQNRSHLGRTSTQASYAACPPGAPGTMVLAAGETIGAPLVTRLTPAQPSRIQTTPGMISSVT